MPFWYENGCSLAHLGLESGTVLEELVGVYEGIHRFSQSKCGRRKEKYANSKRI